MIAIFNSLPVVSGASAQVAERFAGSGGHVQYFPGFVSMEVLTSDEEVLVITRWDDRESFDAWVQSDSFRKAHSGGGSSEGLISGRPKMSSYEIAVTRPASERES